MNTLWFFKARQRGGSEQIVFLFTADSEQEAVQRGFSMIAEFCRHEFEVVEATRVCQTPDIVECFEPC